MLHVHVSNKTSNNISYGYIENIFLLCLITYVTNIYIYILFLYLLFNFNFIPVECWIPISLSASLTIHMWAPDAVPKRTVGFGHTPPKLPIRLGTYTCSTIAARDCCFLLMKFKPAKGRRPPHHHRCESMYQTNNARDHRPCESTCQITKSGHTTTTLCHG